MAAKNTSLISPKTGKQFVFTPPAKAKTLPVDPLKEGLKVPRPPKKRYPKPAPKIKGVGKKSGAVRRKNAAFKREKEALFKKFESSCCM
jgi:hypothetical protein